MPGPKSPTRDQTQHSSEASSSQETSRPTSMESLPPAPPLRLANVLKKTPLDISIEEFNFAANAAKENNEQAKTLFVKVVTAYIDQAGTIADDNQDALNKTIEFLEAAAQFDLLAAEQEGNRAAALATINGKLQAAKTVKKTDDTVVVGSNVDKYHQAWGIGLATFGSVCGAGSAVAAGILLSTFLASSPSFTDAITSMYNAYPIITISLAAAFVVGAVLIGVGAHFVKASKAGAFASKTTASNEGAEAAAKAESPNTDPQ